MAFDIVGARKSGVPDSVIADHLANQRGFDIAGARKSGVPDSAVIDWMQNNPQDSSTAIERNVAPVVNAFAKLGQSSIGIMDLGAKGLDVAADYLSDGKVRIPTVTEGIKRTTGFDINEQIQKSEEAKNALIGAKRRQQSENVSNAFDESLLSGAASLKDNPDYVLTALEEQIPNLLTMPLALRNGVAKIFTAAGGGAAGAAAVKAALPTIAKKSAVLEGAMTAGSAAGEKSSDGLSNTETASALGQGAATTIGSLVANKLGAKYLGSGDLESKLATKGLSDVIESGEGVVGRAIAAGKEGLKSGAENALEEGLQNPLEQIPKSIEEGDTVGQYFDKAGRQAVEGIVVGGLSGGASAGVASLLSDGSPTNKVEQDNEPVSDNPNMTMADLAMQEEDLRNELPRVNPENNVEPEVDANNKNHMEQDVVDPVMDDEDAKIIADAELRADADNASRKAKLLKLAADAEEKIYTKKYSEGFANEEEKKAYGDRLVLAKRLAMEAKNRLDNLNTVIQKTTKNVDDGNVVDENKTNNQTQEQPIPPSYNDEVSAKDDEIGQGRAAGVLGYQSGAPRQLPESLTNADPSVKRAWYHGWDMANSESSQQQAQPETNEQMQPRDRDKVTSVEQLTGIARKPDYDRVSQSKEEGANAGGSGGDRSSSGETFNLESYTNEEIAQREDAAKAAAEAEAKAARDAENKASADAEVGQFTLTGSDRQADVAASAGQNDLFGVGSTRKSAEADSSQQFNPLKDDAGVEKTSNDKIADTLKKAKAAGVKDIKKLKKTIEKYGEGLTEFDRVPEQYSGSKTPAKTSTVSPSSSPEEGQVSQRKTLEPGDVFVTLSGRHTTPFPKYSLKPSAGQSTKDNKKILAWLKENAIAEAQARNDKFNLLQFQVLNINNWSPADGYSVNLYMFGDEYGELAPFRVDETRPSSSKENAKRDANANDTRQNAKQEPKNATNKIEDFGEKLEGKRTYTPSFVSGKPTENDITTKPLSEIWPSNAHEKIEDKQEAALVFALRSEIPAKPRNSYKLSRWVEKIQEALSIAKGDFFAGVGGKVTADLIREKGTPRLHQFANRLETLYNIDREQWSRLGDVAIYPDSYSYDEQGNKVASPNGMFEVDGKRHRVNGVKTVADILPAIERALGEDKKKEKIAFQVRGTDNYAYIMKTGDKEYRRLKEFKTGKEALDYLKNNYDDVLSAWNAVKDRDNVSKADTRRDTNRPRTGADHRKGKDATPEMFEKAFGFRGVEFGNWVSQGANAKERQGMLNLVYDSLHDLAAILNIPTKAVSLNGTLGLSLGSRGSGNASAHFERDNLVINLTKTKGAGTLAHEWFHALDNYFSRMRREDKTPTKKREGDFITYKPEAYYQKGDQYIPVKDFEEAVAAGRDKYDYDKTYSEARRKHAATWRVIGKTADGWVKRDAVRPEVEQAFADLVEALNASPMAARSRLLDKNPKNDYWSRIIERGARSFENYVISKMRSQGYDNDYLANVVPVEDFVRNQDRYPYLMPSEEAPVVEAFDNLFDTIQTKEGDDGNVMLFSRDAGKQDDISDQVADDIITLYKELGSDESVFQYDKSVMDTIDDTVFSVLPDGSKQEADDLTLEMAKEEAKDRGQPEVVDVRKYVIPTVETVTGRDNKPILDRDGNPQMQNMKLGAYVYTNVLGEMWVDLSELKKAGGIGGKIYSKVADFAHENGLVFIGDPLGLSDDAMVKRTEHMASGIARRKGTSQFAPHPRQVSPYVKDAKDSAELARIVRPLKWIKGNDRFNQREIIKTAYHNITKIIPELRHAWIDINDGRIYQAGSPIDTPFDDWVRDLQEGKFSKDGQRREDSAGGLAGQRAPLDTFRHLFASASIKRQLLANTVAQYAGESAEKRRQVLDRLGAILPDLESLDDRKVFYKRGGYDTDLTVSDDTVKRIIADFLNTYRGAVKLDFKIFDSAESAFGHKALGDAGVAGQKIKGGYDNGRVIIIRNGHRNAREVLETIRHEVWAHHGFNLLGDKLKRTTIDRVSSIIDTSKELSALRDKVNSKYKKNDGTTIDNDVLIEEVVAHIAEKYGDRIHDAATSKPLSAPVAAAKKIMGYIGGALRSVGILSKKDDGISQVVDILSGFARDMTREDSGSLSYADGKALKFSRQSNTSKKFDNVKELISRAKLAAASKAALNKWVKKERGLTESDYADYREGQGELHTINGILVPRLTSKIKKAWKAEYGTDNIMQDVRKAYELKKYLDGDKNAKLPDSIKHVADMMRAEIDLKSAQIVDIISDDIQHLSTIMDTDALDAANSFLNLSKSVSNSSMSREDSNKILSEAAKKAINSVDGSAQKSFISDFIAKSQQIDSILANKGKYMNRSYQAHNDPDWMSKIIDDRYSSAGDDYKKNIVNHKVYDMAAKDILKGNPQATDKEIYTAIRQILQDASDVSNPMAAFGSSALIKKMGIFKGRKLDDMAGIRMLLGEYNNPVFAFANTMAKQTNIIASHKFLKGVRDNGLESGLFSTKQEGNYQREITGNGMSPLSGLYTTEKYYNTINDVLHKDKPESYISALLHVSALIKAGKTVLSPGTSILNFLSNASNAMSLGHWSPKAVAKTAKFFVDYSRGDKDAEALMDEAGRLGVISGSLFSHEVAKYIKEHHDVLANEKENIKRFMKPARMYVDAMTWFYEFGDNAWKINAYFNEIENGVGKTKAADIVANGYPNYSTVPKTVDMLKTVPFISDFPSFVWEQYRVSAHQLKWIADEYKDGNKAKALSAATRFIIARGLLPAAAYAISLANGWDYDEGEEYQQRMMAPWDKNGAFIFMPKDGKGNVSAFNIGRYSMYDTQVKVIKAIVAGEPVQAVKEALSGLASFEMWVDALYAAATGKTSSGALIYSDSDTAGDKVKKGSEFLWTQLAPTVLSKNARDFTQSNADLINHTLEGTPLASMGVSGNAKGKNYSNKASALQLIGVRNQNMNASSSLKNKIIQNSITLRANQKTVRDLLGSQSYINNAQVADVVLDYLKQYDRANNRISEDARYLISSGVAEKNVVFEALKSANVSKENAARIVTGSPVRWKPSKDMVEYIKDQIFNSDLPADKKREYLSQRIKVMNQTINNHYAGKSK